MLLLGVYGLFTPSVATPTHVLVGKDFRSSVGVRSERDSK